MNRTRTILSALAIASMAVALAGCSSGAPSSAPKDGPLKISLLTTYNGLPFYTAMQCGAKDAAKKLGGQITLTADGPSRGMNAADQVPVLEGVVNRGPDGIIFVPADPVAMEAPIRTAVDSGIKVVTTDATLDSKIALAQFHGDNQAGGKLAADEMLKLAGNKGGKILVLDNRPGLPITNDRAKGFIDALKASGSKLTILDTQYFEDDPTKAATIVQSTLQSNPDIVGIFATAEAGATGTVSGLEAVGDASKKVSVIAYDAGPTLVDALKAGKLAALIAQGSYTQGYDAMTALVKSIRGQKSGQFDNIVDNALVTADNVNDPKIAKLLYPNSCS